MRAVTNNSAAVPVGPPASGVSSVEIEGRVSVFNPATDRVLALNESASAIWQLCTGEHTLDAIATLLAERYGVDLEAIRADVVTTVDGFHVEGLLDDGGEAARSST